MASVFEVIGAVEQIREAVSSMTREKSRQEFDYPNEHFARIGQALSDIHFYDDGILAVLRKTVARSGEEGQKLGQAIRNYWSD